MRLHCWYSKWQRVSGNWVSCRCEMYTEVLKGEVIVWGWGLRERLEYRSVAPKHDWSITSSVTYMERNCSSYFFSPNNSCWSCKSIPLQALTGPESFRRLRLSDFKTIGTWRWQGCQPYAFIPRKYSWYSFLLEAESTQGHSAAGRIMSMNTGRVAVLIIRQTLISGDGCSHLSETLQVNILDNSLMARTSVTIA
jgi:hypothetical protein